MLGYLLAGSSAALVSFCLGWKVVTRLNSLLEGLSSTLLDGECSGAEPGPYRRQHRVSEKRMRPHRTRKAVAGPGACKPRLGLESDVLECLSKGFSYKEIPRSVFAAKRVVPPAGGFKPQVMGRKFGKRSCKRLVPRFERIPENISL